MSFYIADNQICANFPGWTQSLSCSTPVRCEIYNTMEATPQWRDATPLWHLRREFSEGWILPFEISLPLFGQVISFELTGRRVAEAKFEISCDNVVEARPDLIKIMRLDLLPGFAQGLPGDAGYLFLPCYSGVLHTFTHKVSRELRLAIYTRQDQWAMHSNFNCLGITTPSFAMSASFSSETYNAEIVARSHWEAESEYSVHASFVFRTTHGESPYQERRSVRYTLYSSSDGNWDAFARAYRSDLRSESRLPTWQEKAESSAEFRNYSDSFLMKIFQGHKDITPDGSGTYRSCTTFGEAKSLLQELQRDGIATITAEMVGWNYEGHDGRYPQRFPVNEAAGGEALFRDLISWGKSNGVCISVHDNCYDSYPTADCFDRDDLVVLSDGHVWRNIPWAGGHAYKICPLRMRKYLEPHYARMRDLGISGHYYLDALGAFYPCESPDHPADRETFIRAVRDALLYTRETFGTMNVEVPLAPYFDSIDGTYIDDNCYFLDAFSDFRKQWIDAVVPFLPIVLHNGIRYQRSSGGKTGLARSLHDLAWGAMPFIEVAARPHAGAHKIPTYRDLREYALSSWQLSCGKYRDRISQDLDRVSMIEPGLFVSDYRDGVSIMINANDTPRTHDGVDLPPLSEKRIS